MKEEQGKVVGHEIKEVLLQYTCPALPPVGISMDKLYKFGKDEKGYFFSFLDEKIYNELEYIQMLFTPRNKTWKDIIK